LHILYHPDLEFIFADNSLAEISVSGKIDNNSMLAGQIDRLIITRDTIWIIDFKSNEKPPSCVSHLSMLYKNQLAYYKNAIKEIYPDHHVKTAILWTKTADLMKI